MQALQYLAAPPRVFTRRPLQLAQQVSSTVRHGVQTMKKDDMMWQKSDDAEWAGEEEWPVSSITDIVFDEENKVAFAHCFFLFNPSSHFFVLSLFYP